MRQSCTVLKEILLSGAPFEEGFSFTVEKHAGPVKKEKPSLYRGSLAKIYHPRTQTFSQIHHYTYS
jgi:hypothetical protein